MKKNTHFSTIATLLLILFLTACSDNEKMEITIYETNAKGNKLTKVEANSTDPNAGILEILPSQKFQTILGFGGSFTESSSYLLNKLSKEKRQEVVEAYFGTSGAAYSLTRTHMNSCDFSLSQYSYAPIEDDKGLKNLSVDEDKDDIIPFIKDAMEVSEDGFKILSSPWTAPPWMKDNNKWVGGNLLKEYYPTWALFFSKYLEAYKNEGIDIWGVTVENEPHGNGNNWESMHYTPEEMTDFVSNYLGPQLEKDNWGKVKIFGYDQNRNDLNHWIDVMFKDEKSSKYYAGTAIHWYESTYKVFPEELQYAHKMAPDKHLLQTEACVDSEVPKWKDDAWYWSKVATDWGWDWAPANQKHWHPKYVPVYRYARDIIGCLNNWVEGWIDWNMILDKQGGPNWFKNWCVAPVLVDPDSDEVYYTPIYYTLAHFSKYIRPGATIIGHVHSDASLLSTTAKNPDGSIVCILLNQQKTEKKIKIKLDNQTSTVTISPQAIQTIIL